MLTETQLILIFWGAVFAGLALGGLIGWWRGMTWGFAIGCLVIGLGSGSAAGLMAFQRWQFVQKGVLVQGTLLRDRNGPEVQFHTPDGITHLVHGLGGSQSGKAPGDPVPVRYPAADPSQALVADFQNLWGGVLAFTLFGALPLAFGAFMTGVARGDSRPARVGVPAAPKALSPMRQRFAGNLTIAGNVVMLAGFGAAMFGEESMAGLGRAFLVIGIGATLFAIAFWIRREGDWQAPAICLIVALGFVLFGGGAMLLGGR